MAHEHSLHAEIIKAVAKSDLPVMQKVRIRVLMRVPVICEMVCHAVETRLMDEGVLLRDDVVVTGTDQRWDPESWDWDAIVERLKDLVSFVVEIILKLLPLFV